MLIVNPDWIHSIQAIGQLAGALVGTWAFIKLIVASKKYIKKLYFWLLERMLKTYVEKVAQEKINERLSNIAEQLVDEDIIKLKEIAQKTISSTTSWHTLGDDVFIKLKSLGLVNETFDYASSNLRLKTALKNPTAYNKHQILYPGMPPHNLYPLEIDYNIEIDNDDTNNLQVYYKTKDGFNKVKFIDFIQKIGFSSANMEQPHLLFKELGAYLQENMTYHYPYCMESDTINALLYVNVHPTSDGWTFVNLLESIQKFTENENYKRCSATDKATKMLIRKFSKIHN